MSKEIEKIRFDTGRLYYDKNKNKVSKVMEANLAPGLKKHDVSFLLQVQQGKGMNEVL